MSPNKVGLIRDCPGQRDVEIVPVVGDRGEQVGEGVDHFSRAETSNTPLGDFFAAMWTLSI